MDTEETGKPRMERRTERMFVLRRLWPPQASRCRSREQEPHSEEWVVIREILAKARPIDLPRSFVLTSGQLLKPRRRLWYPYLRTITAGVAAFVLLVFAASLWMPDGQAPSLTYPSPSAKCVAPTTILRAAARTTARSTASASPEIAAPALEEGPRGAEAILRFLGVGGLALLGVFLSLTCWAYRKERRFHG
jgi:hypothetical protein